MKKLSNFDIFTEICTTIGYAIGCLGVFIAVIEENWILIIGLATIMITTELIGIQKEIRRNYLWEKEKEK